MNKFGSITGNTGDTGDIVNSQSDSEYTFFKNLKRESENGTYNKEISSMIDGLSSPALQVASVLTKEECSGRKEAEQKETALWYILTIGYVNRKFCLGAEGVVKKQEGGWYDKNKSETKVNDFLEDTNNNQNDCNALQLFSNCLRPRLNYIGAQPYMGEEPYDTELFIENGKNENKINGKETVEKLVKRFDGLSTDKKLDVPFSKQIHRLRKPPENNPSDAHLLGIDAGAHINAITQESTLGKIRQSLGLPLRCDISGTTVDAMGFCDTFIKKGENSNNKKRMVYLVSCMLSMCLTGHHSLDEMALALSLDVKERDGLKKYDPCEPASVIDLLKEWSGWTDFVFSYTKYFNAKAAGILRLFDKPIKNLEFTKQLWDGLAIHNKIMKGWTYHGDELIPPKAITTQQRTF